MRSVFLISFFLTLLIQVRSQSTLSFEQYSFIGTGQPGLLAPVAHYESPHKWYAEARYNYEDVQTVSLYAGRTFAATNNFSWSLTPMIGGMAGKLNGGSVGLHAGCSYGKFNFSSESQYSVAASTRYDNFFYNWSELWYQPADWMYTGFALQHTRLYAASSLIDPGIMLGFSYHKWSFPLYSFNMFSERRYFVLGINWEWKHAGNRQKKPASLLYSSAGIVE